MKREIAAIDDGALLIDIVSEALDLGLENGL